MPLFKPNIAALQAKRDIAGLTQALKLNDVRVRGEAIKALGLLGDARAVPALSACLLARDSDPPTQIAAVSALGKIGDAAAIAPLLQANALSQERERAEIDASMNTPARAYRNEFYINRIATHEYELRVTIAHALGAIGGTPALTALFGLLATEKGAMESGVKRAVKDAISETIKNPAEPTITFLLEQLGHTTSEVRAWTAQLLGQFALPPVAAALADTACDEQEDYTVRVVALAGLGNIGDTASLPRLEELARAGNRGLARDARQTIIAIRQRANLPNLVGF